MVDKPGAVISLDDCKHIIKNYLQCDNFQLLNYELQPYTRSTDVFKAKNLLLKIKILWEETKKEVRFLVKQSPSDNAPSNNFASLTDNLENEIYVYEVLFEKFNKCQGFDNNFTPKWYFGKNNKVIVLEDLSQRGFIVFDNQNSLSTDHLKLSFKALAKFHAGSIMYQELKSKQLGKKYTLLDEYAKNIQEPLFRNEEGFSGYHWLQTMMKALNALVDLLPPSNEISNQEFKKKLVKVAEEAFEILKPKDTFYNVLCHGDMKIQNVVFKHRNKVPVECKLINFQPRYGPPAHDVLQFIYLTTNTGGRKHHLHELLNHYYHSLQLELQNGDLSIEKILPLEDYEISINHLLPQIKLQTAYYHAFQGVSLKQKLEIKNSEKLQEVVFDNNANFFADLFQTDENYRKLMTQALTELKDLVTHPRVTVEDCFKIISSKLKTTNYDLLNYSIKPLGKLSGFLGDHYKLKIDVILNNQKQTLHLFVKCSPESQARYKMAISSKAFLKESFMVQKLIPLIQEVCENAIDECIIPCYLVRLNDIVVFDDIEIENFQPLSPRVPFTKDHLQVVLKKLAIYHASNIVLEEKLSQKTQTTYRIIDHFKNELEERFYAEDLKHLATIHIRLGMDTIPYQIDFFPDPQAKISQQDFKAKAKKAYAAVYELIKPSKKYRNVVCHGDLWASNVMMKYQDGKPIDCLIIDYQILRYCPPAHDLLCFLYLTTNRKTRSQFMPELIDFYYEEFAKTLKRYGCNVEEIYSYETFLESCDYLTPMAVCQTAIYYHFQMTNSDLIGKYTEKEENWHKIFYEERKEFLAEMCKDPVYRERLGETIQDLREMCMKYY